MTSRRDDPPSEASDLPPVDSTSSRAAGPDDRSDPLAPSEPFPAPAPIEAPTPWPDPPSGDPSPDGGSLDETDTVDGGTTPARPAPASTWDLPEIPERPRPAQTNPNLWSTTPVSHDSADTRPDGARARGYVEAALDADIVDAEIVGSTPAADRLSARPSADAAATPPSDHDAEIGGDEGTVAVADGAGSGDLEAGSAVLDAGPDGGPDGVDEAAADGTAAVGHEEAETLDTGFHPIGEQAERETGAGPPSPPRVHETGIAPTSRPGPVRPGASPSPDRIVSDPGSARAGWFATVTVAALVVASAMVGAVVIISATRGPDLAGLELSTDIAEIETARPDPSPDLAPSASDPAVASDDPNGSNPEPEPAETTSEPANEVTTTTPVRSLPGVPTGQLPRGDDPVSPPPVTREQLTAALVPLFNADLVRCVVDAAFAGFDQPVIDRYAYAAGESALTPRERRAWESLWASCLP